MTAPFAADREVDRSVTGALNSVESGPARPVAVGLPDSAVFLEGASMSPCTTYHWRVFPIPDGAIISLLGHPPWQARWELDDQNNFEGFPSLERSKPAKVYLDCSTLEYLGSAGQGALIKLVRLARTWNGRLVLCNVRPLVAEALSLSKLAGSGLFDMLSEGLPVVPPVLPDPAWLTHNEGAVRQLAAKIKADHGYCNLTELGDALKNAGCDNADILGHCRRPGLHIPGCWVVDLLLGKE
jgi:anti-anti-sigma regulatory factor